MSSLDIQLADAVVFSNPSSYDTDSAKVAAIFPEVIQDFPTFKPIFVDTFSKGLRGWSYHNQSNQAIKPYSPTLDPVYSQRGQSLGLYTPRNPSNDAAKTWARKGQGTPMIPQNAKKIILGYEWAWRSYVDLYGLYRVNFTLDTQLQADLNGTGKRRWLKLSWLNSVGGSSANWHRKWQYDHSFADAVPGTTFNNAGFLFPDPAGTFLVNGQTYSRKTKADFANSELNLFQDVNNTGMTASSDGKLGWVDIPNGKHDYCYNEKYKATFARMAMVIDLDRVNSNAKYGTLYSHGQKFDLTTLPTGETDEDAGEYLNFYENGMNIVVQCENRGVGSKAQSSLHIDLAFCGFVY